MTEHHNNKNLSAVLNNARALSDQTLIRPRDAAAMLGISRKHLYALAELTLLLRQSYWMLVMKYYLFCQIRNVQVFSAGTLLTLETPKRSTNISGNARVMVLV